jgi:hypothetical protein
MTRRTTPAAEATPAAEEPASPTLPDFTPVPRKCNRHDGWTLARQRAFIHALADTGSVKRACAAVNMSTEGAYHLRRQPGAEAFDAAWAAALAPRIEILRDDVLERAIHGVEVPVYSYGKLVGTRRVYNDRTALFMLRNYDGQMSGGASGLPIRLKRIVEEEVARARAEWEAERRGNHKDARRLLIEDMNRVRAHLIAQGLVEDDEHPPASEP